MRSAGRLRGGPESEAWENSREYSGRRRPLLDGSGAAVIHRACMHAPCPLVEGMQGVVAAPYLLSEALMAKKKTGSTRTQAVAGRRAPQLSHVDKAGCVKMVDVGAKRVTRREAVAQGVITIAPDALALIRDGRIAKGDPLQTARVAGIMAAKRTAELIPLCHPLPLSHVEVTLHAESTGYVIEATARTTAQTGVEMEALTAVSVAALTIYDMVKAVDKTMVIGDVRLMTKTGGRSGTYRRK